MDIFLLTFGEELFNELLVIYTAPWARPLEVLLLFGLLFHALTHGVNGLRTVLEDYVRTPRRLLAVKGAVYVVAFLLTSAGAYVIFTFDVTA